MRRSAIYNSYLTTAGVTKVNQEPDTEQLHLDFTVIFSQLLTRYEYSMILAEQDWMTNLGWSHPELFHRFRYL